MRTRHLYLQAEKDGWSILAGQTWMLFGWQPYYFMPTLEVSPTSGMLYNRTAQLRAMKTASLDGNETLQTALGLMRPPQRDSEYPGVEAGVRMAFGNRTGGFAGGATTPQKTQPMSVGLSGAFRQITASSTSSPVHYSGYAVAADALLPLIASSDGKDVSHTLTLGGEFTTGKGYGDQFVGWTGGQTIPVSAGSFTVDPGIGGADSATGSFDLIKLQSFNGYLQYHLAAETRSWISAGYGQLYSSNIGDFVAKGAYNKQQMMFGNFAHDFTNQLRAGIEYAYARSSYVGGQALHNSRVQLSAWFIF
jgi:hypothetical protein